jgi:hypothetical protein
MKLLKVFKPEELSNRGMAGTAYIRMDNNSISFSPMFCNQFGLVLKKTILDFTLIEWGKDNQELYAFLVDFSTDGLLLRGNHNAAGINSTAMAQKIAAHYHLESIVDPKGEYKNHKFDYVVEQYEGKTVIILLPLKKFGE